MGFDPQKEFLVVDVPVNYVVCNHLESVPIGAPLSERIPIDRQEVKLKETTFAETSDGQGRWVTRWVGVCPKCGKQYATLPS